MVLKRLEGRGVKVKIGEEIEDFLLEKGYSIKFGAKALNKVIENELLKPLAEYISNCEKKNITVSISKDKKLSFVCK